MIKFIYNCFLVLATVLMLPKALWDLIVHKKYRRSFAEKLGWKTPNFSIPENILRGAPQYNMCIWIHAVSMGETKAVISLVRTIQQHLPQATIVFSSTTETGHEEAKRSMPDLAAYFFLPIDFSWVIKKLTRRLKPDILILVESEFWYNLVHSVKTVALVNGKISDRSYKRFKKIPFFASRLFSRFSLVCLQSERYAPLFASLGLDPAKIIATGNLKFDQPLPSLDPEKWKKELGITEQDRIITIGSTHPNEEEMLLTVLEPLSHTFSNLKILLVPRHPERFNTVADLLEKKGISFARFSDHKPKTGNERIILVDAMGILNPCYRLAELAIVGGSFVEHVGGHNIFEPASLGVPVLFGPHMYSQKDLVEIVVSSCAGQQVTLEDLPKILLQYLEHPPTFMREAGLRLAKEVHGSTARTWAALSQLLYTVPK